MWLCAVTLWPGALQAVCQPLLSPVGPIRTPEWERLWITHLYPLKASEAGEEKRGGGRGGMQQRGSHWPQCTDGFQPRHVTRIAPVVTLTRGLVSLSDAAHMPFIPRGDVLHDDWGVRGRRVIRPHALSSHWLIASTVFDALSSECQRDFACPACSAELCKILASGSWLLEEEIFSTTPSSPNYCRRILIVFPWMKTSLVRHWGARHTLHASVFASTFSSLLAALLTASLFSCRLTFTLPARGDTLRTCSLSSVTDIKTKD